jgi:aryl-alcohol dehydrogenase-like predicted oxidoreductase
MESITLGRGGPVVSRVGLGLMGMSGIYGPADETESIATIRAALDAGITLLDTADFYGMGHNEMLLRDALRGVDRGSVFIQVKFGGQRDPRGAFIGHDASPNAVKNSLAYSLQRLGTDYVDLYQAHRFDHETPLEETLRAFDDLVRQGKVLYVGVSEWRAEEIARALKIADEMGFDRIVSNQPQYNMLWRVIESEVLPLCEQEGLGQIVFSPLAQGVLTGKYAPGQPPPPDSRAASEIMGAFIGALMQGPVLEAVARLRPVAEQAGLSLVEMALAWVLRRDELASAIVGASRPEQVRADAAASGVELSTDTLEAIDAALGDTPIRQPTLAPLARAGVMHR